MFIKNLGSLIIIDVDNKEMITLLDEITSPATAVYDYQVVLNEQRMVIAADPGILEEYTL